MIMFVVVVVAMVALIVAAGRLGADSRPLDPGRSEPDWPFIRHG